MKVLIGYDGSVDADGALYDLHTAGLPDRTEALVLAEAPPWVTLAPGEDTGPGPLLGARVPYPDTPAQSRRLAAQVAARGADQLRAFFPRWKVKSRGGDLDPATGILETADAWKPGLIVVGSHGRGALTRLFLGSVSQKILNHARTDVRITRPRIRTGLGPPRILVGMDGSRGGLGAVAAMAARSWPSGSKARILAVLPGVAGEAADAAGAHPWQAFLREYRARMERELEKAAGRLAGAGLDVATVLRAGDARDAILKEAVTWKADSICLGSRGLGALRRFLIGSVSSAVAANAHCTVEVVRGHRRAPRGKV